MMRPLSILLSIFLIANSSVAQEISHLEKGEPAPYAGVLITDAHMKSIYAQFIECDHLKLITESLEESIKLYQENQDAYLKEVVELKDQNLNLQTSLEKSKSSNFWNNTFWFILGIATTSAVVYATQNR